jgi:hypothetical protein
MASRTSSTISLISTKWSETAKGTILRISAKWSGKTARQDQPSPASAFVYFGATRRRDKLRLKICVNS